VELTAKAGGSFIKIDPSGVTLSGPTVKINSGGAAGQGSGLDIRLPVVPTPAALDLVVNPLGTARTNAVATKLEPEPAEHRFNMRLLDVPGDDGFPLAYTPWQLVDGGGEAIFDGETDEQGLVRLDEVQQQVLSNRYHITGPIWLCYPGQRVKLSMHIERENWHADSVAMAALDYSDHVSPAQCNAPLFAQRSKEDSQCAADLYTHLQSKA